MNFLENASRLFPCEQATTPAKKFRLALSVSMETGKRCPNHKEDKNQSCKRCQPFVDQACDWAKGNIEPPQWFIDMTNGRPVSNTDPNIHTENETELPF